ncbi:MAG TPA: polysaccharide biosynthesis tyrosine autokinase [Flavitalea sp.]|nr:polysaccharide biosynthesis tyrosine autokinase [Flavitalea sp.]
MHTNSYEFANEDNLIQKLVAKYLPFWPLFLLAAITGAAIAFAYLRYATPIFEATATIIIKDEKKGNESSKLSESLDIISAKKIVENEVEILQSRSLMVKAVKALGLYAPIYEEGRLKKISAYTKFPISIQAANVDSIKGVKRVNIFYNKRDQTVLLNNKYKYGINEFVTTPFGRLKFVPNKYYDGTFSSDKNYFFSLSTPRNMAEALVAGVIAQPANKLSSIVDLYYYDEVPERAENILTELIIAYNQAAIDEKNNLAANTMSFLDKRLEILARDLDSIEKKVQQYKSQQGAVDISAQGQLFLQNVSSNDQRLSEVNIKLSVLEQVEKFVADKVNTGAIVPSTLGISDPMLSQLLDNLYNAELQYEKLRKTVGPNNPALVAVVDQINKIRPSILENIHSQQQSLYAERGDLNDVNGKYSAMLKSVPQKERQLLDINREHATKGSIYAFLLQKREESAVSYASAVSDHIVVDSPKSGSTPVSPKKRNIYLMAIVGCLALSIGFITIKESLNGKVMYRQEVESRTSIPIIAEIPFVKSKTSLVIAENTRSFIAEGFRKLRISLSYLGLNATHKKILVTSSISGEGKSFIAANLAVSLSLTGKKVVVVDLDLNNPTISKIFDVVDEGGGVTECLTGEKRPEQIIRRIKENENLYLISAGSLPENPTELLANGKVKDIIDYLEKVFDVVVIDTSPSAMVTDAFILSPLCNATLYVVRHKYTPKMLIKRIDENNQINPIVNPAIIFNGVKIRGFFKNNYGYGYDYVYVNKRKDGKAKKAGNKKLI